MGVLVAAVNTYTAHMWIDQYRKTKDGFYVLLAVGHACMSLLVLASCVRGCW